MDKPTILVTGGAGYIGSHVISLLKARDARVVILDDLSTGFEENIFYGDLVQGSCGDEKCLEHVFSTYQVGAVMHFAASTIVAESMASPLAYYHNNVTNSQVLLAKCAEHQVKKFIFSSSAAVYGQPSTSIVSEQTMPQPISPYGRTKLMVEWMLRDLAASSDIKFVALRYFNVAGASPNDGIGQRTKDATHLIKIATQAALGQRDKVTVFGNDYETPDGTGVRDYIHVMDLASAHLAALDYLSEGNDSVVLNCGYGKGYSVLEVIDAINRQLSNPLTIAHGPRRPGDPAALIADTDKLSKLLSWQPQYDDLDTIVESALAWESKLCNAVE